MSAPSYTPSPTSDDVPSYMRSTSASTKKERQTAPQALTSQQRRRSSVGLAQSTSDLRSVAKDVEEDTRYFVDLKSNLALLSNKHHSLLKSVFTKIMAKLFMFPYFLGILVSFWGNVFDGDKKSLKLLSLSTGGHINFTSFSSIP